MKLPLGQSCPAVHPPTHTHTRLTRSIVFSATQDIYHWRFLICEPISPPPPISSYTYIHKYNILNDYYTNKYNMANMTKKREMIDSIDSVWQFKKLYIFISRFVGCINYRCPTSSCFRFDLFRSWNIPCVYMCNPLSPVVDDGDSNGRALYTTFFSIPSISLSLSLLILSSSVY
jgi:hypothetical protein